MSCCVKGTLGGNLSFVQGGIKLGKRGNIKEKESVHFNE